MMQTLRLIASDKFIWLLSAAVLLAALLPVDGAAVPVASAAVTVGIFTIFLLHGIRIDRHEIFAGLKNWRLQGSIFLFVFGAMMLAGLALSALIDGAVAPMIALGFLYLGCLPSTVQSAASYTAIAKGNVGASVVAAALINLSAILVTPVMFALLARSVGVVVTSDTFIRIMTMLLLPFIIGQIIQPWARPFERSWSWLTGWADKIAISLAVYVAFSGAIVSGVWETVPITDLALVALCVTVLLAFAFSGAWLLGGWNAFARKDRIALLFGGAHKSIAVGAPLAALLFAPQQAGLLLIPLLLYHVSSLVISAPLALKLAED